MDKVGSLTKCHTGVKTKGDKFDSVLQPFINMRNIYKGGNSGNTFKAFCINTIKIKLLF